MVSRHDSHIWPYKISLCEILLDAEGWRFTCLVKTLVRTFASICSCAILASRKLFYSMIHYPGVSFTVLEATFVVTVEVTSAMKNNSNVCFCEIIHRQMCAFTYWAIIIEMWGILTRRSSALKYWWFMYLPC